MRIAVTGGSGKGGAWVVRDLREHGHEVLSVDWRSDSSGSERTLVTDLTDLGQAQDALSGVDAVVHFAAIPAPLLRPEGETFRINTLSTYNVFAAAVDHRVKRVVWASSETVLGLPFDVPPAFAPIDESIEPHPESSYSLSKLVGETMAVQFARRSGIGFVGLRISNIMAPEDYAQFASWQDDPTIRKWNLWSYVDARDVAQAVRLGLEAPITGAEVAIIAAADSVMTRPSAELMAEVFPTVPFRQPIEGRQTLLSIEHARRVLGYQPSHRWADHV
ncbi:MAG TPA: NAD(P)-dependent oxidoreductase [Candidatus Limnocylindrales bacterium]|nr:NAD(P)-dependent oxidoreductase [Candidatus Limnocylindrales bacterium]